MVFINRISKIVILTLLLLVSIGVESFAQAGDIHQNLCKGGSRVVTFQSTSTYYRWYVINRTTGVTDIYNTNNHEYTFVMPDANDVYEVYVEYRDNNWGSWTKSSNSVIMYPYDFPDAIINPSGSVEFSGSVTLNGSVSGVLPSSNFPITLPLDINYEWVYNGASVETGDGSTDSYSASNGGNYVYRVFDSNQKVSGCSSSSPITELTESLVFNIPVCEGGFITGEMLMDIGSVPMGHRDGGTWDETAGLIFSDFGRSPIITGYLSGNSYLVKWYRNPAKTYSFNLIAGSGYSFELQNESGTTSDVILCTGTHTFSVNPAGDTHTFMVNNLTDGTTTELASGVSNSYAFSSPNPNAIYEVYAIVEKNGCYFETNPIKVSSDEDVEIKVVGDESVCSGDFDIVLEAIPYDPAYTYSWERNNINVGGGQFLNVLPFGNGEYIVKVIGCGGVEYESKPVTVNNYVLPDARINPTGNVLVCTGDSRSLNGYMDGIHPTGANMTYEWLYNGAGGLASGAGVTSSISVSNIGDYEYKLYETDNPLCYSVSPPTSLVSIDLSFNSFIANGSTTFCGSTIASASLEASLAGTTGQISVTITNITNGTSQLVLLNTGESKNVSFGILSTTNTYKVTAVSAAGCSLTPTEIDAIPEITFTRGNDPIVFNLTGSDYCGNGVIGLDGSEVGVDYYLYLNNVFVAGSTQLGTGLPISFGNQSVEGVYTIRGEVVSCENLTDMNGQLTIYRKPLLDLNVSIAGSGCAGSAHAITVSNTEVGISYRLYRGTTAVSSIQPGTGGDMVFSGIVTAGNYTVMALNGACQETLDNSVFIAPTPLLQNLLETVGCEGVDFFVELAGSEVDVEYRVTNSGGSILETILGDGGPLAFTTPLVSADVYTVTAINGYGCSRNIGTVTLLTQPVTTYILSTPVSPACSGTDHVLTLSGSQIGVTYRLYRNNTTGTPLTSVVGTGLVISFGPQSVAGTYIVTANNAGCEVVLPSELVMYQQPNVYSIVGGTYCEDDDVIITLNNSQSSVTYYLYRDGVDYGSDQTGITGAPITFGPEKYPPGTYTIRGSSGGCFANMAGLVTVNSNPIINIPNLSSSYCADAGSVTISGSPANANGSWSVVGYSPLPNNFTDNGNGTLSFDVGNVLDNYGQRSFIIGYSYVDPNGCNSFIERTTLFQDDLGDVVRFEGLPAVTCQGASAFNLQAYLNYSTRINITTNDGVFSGAGITDNANGKGTFDPDVAGNGVHNITYSYTDPNTGCNGSYSISVQVGTTLTIEGLDPIYCVEDGEQQWYGTPEGETLIIYKVDGAGNRTLLTQKANVSQIDPLKFNPSVSGSGKYVAVYSYIDGSGCENKIEEPFVVEVELNTSFGTSSGDTQFCENGSSVTLVPLQPGGYYSGDGVSGNTFSPSVAREGDHIVTYTINTGACNSSTDLTLTVIKVPDLSIDFIQDKYCENAAGPIKLEANNDGIINAIYTFSSTLNVAGRSPIYVSNPGDRNGVDIVDDQFYFDPAYVGEGTYHITYTFDNSANSGCTAVYTKTVHVLNAPEVNFGGIADPIEYCHDGSIVELTGSFVSGGLTGSGNFSGSGIINGTLDDGVAEFDPRMVIPGDYPITYTYTHVSGCITSREKIFSVNESPIVYNITPYSTIPNSSKYCEGDAGVTIGVDFSQTGITYELIYNNNIAAPEQTMPGDGSAIEFAVPVKLTGTYTVRAVTGLGCYSMMNGSVQVMMNKVSAAILSENVSCNAGNDGAITVTASGGSIAYVYQISTDETTFSSQASNEFSGLVADTYYIKVTDQIGCEMPAAIPVVINQPSTPLDVTSTTVDVGCLPCIDGGNCDGLATLIITGGSPFADLTTYPSGYSIKWTDASSSDLGSGLSIIDKKPGTYTATVTDAEGCSVNHVVEIFHQPVLTLDEVLSQHINVNCNGAATGVFGVIATGGSGSYEFSLDGVSWFSNGKGIYSFTDLTGNTYKPYVRDAAYPRCEKLSDPIIIVEPDALTLTEVTASHIDVDCFADSTGQVEVVATGGSGDYEYTIDNGANWQLSPTFSGLASGTFYIWVRDLNAETCIYKSVVVTIQQPTKLSLIPDIVNHVICFGGNNGSISVTAAGGSGNYSFSINGGTSWQTDTLFQNLTVGSYEISLRDESSVGCELLNGVSVTINQPKDFTISESIVAHKDVSCFGGNNGSFTVLPSRTGNFQYSVDGLKWQVSPVFNNLVAGGYQVSVRDMSTAAPTYCVKNNVINVFIDQPGASLSIVSHNIKNVSCLGGNDGSIEITVDNGTAPYNYQWYRVTGSGKVPLGVTNTGNTNKATNLVKGEYFVMVTDDHGCPTNHTYSIVEPATGASITVDDIDNVTIMGGNDGAIEISVSDGSTPYSSIIWSGKEMGGASVAGLTDGIYRQENLIAGVYKVEVTDANGCVTLRDNIVVSQPGMNLGFIITKTNPQPCNGLSNGTINLSVVGGTQPYKSIKLTNSALFEYPKNAFGNNYANYIDLPAGNYTATVLDLNGISYSETIVLTEPDAINFTFVKIKDVTCSGETNGTVQLSITGGTAYPGNIADPLIPDNPYYSVLIIPSVGATRSYLVEENLSFVVNDLSEDPYYKVLVEDANTCFAFELFAISQPDPLSVTDSVKNISCHGEADGEILVSILGRPAGTPFTYNWERFDGGIWITHLLDGNALLSGLPVGSYRVKAKEMATGCEVTSAAYDISEPTDLLVDVEVFDVVTCKGDNSGRIVVTVSGGVAPYEVSYGAATVTNNGPVFNLTSLQAGPYSITVKDNNGIGCGKTVSTIIKEPLQSLTISDINANINCDTINTGIVSFKVEGGVSNAANEFSYTVSLLDTLTGTNYGLVVAPTLIQPFTVSINKLPAGEYLLTVTDRIGLPSASCPGYTRNISLQHIDISADVINATCSGVNTGEIKNIVVGGGSGNYLWNWSSPSGGLGLNNANLNQTGLSAGTYVLTLNDLDRSCTVTKTYDVLFGYDIQVTGSTKAVTCAGKSDGAIYNINVSGVSDPDLTFVWSGPDIGIITVVDPANPNITDLAGGTYTLSVTDGNSCVVIETFTVAVPVAIQFDLTTSLDNCDPYSRSITMNNLKGGTGNLSFVWNGPGSFSSTGKNLTGLILGGTYSVTVFDENMCMVNQDITIPGVIDVDATIQHLNCSGEDNGGIVLHVTGGSGDYSYVWSTTDGSGISANIKDQENLTAGTYTVVVTDNIEMVGGTHCSVTESFIVTQPAEIIVTGNKTDVLCAGNNNGTITLDVVGGSGNYTYNWSSGNGTGLVQGVKDQTGLSGGTYSVIVQDEKICNAIANFTIKEPNPLDFTIDYDDTNCLGSNRIEIKGLIGGSGSYQLSWAGPGIPSGFSGTLQQNLPGGIYTIRMTDTGVGALCTIEKSVTLTKELKVSTAISSETCPGELDGSIILTVTNGVAPYTYEWTSISGSPVVTGNKNQNGLSAGEYHVKVTDNRPCIIELDVTVNNLHIIEVNGGITNVTCNGASTGAIDLTVLGGSGNYSYLWSSAGYTATTEDIIDLTAGSYTVVVTDIDYGGCTVTKTFTVTQPATPITVSSADITPVLCNGSATGKIDITVIGGTQPYKYQWSTTSGAVIVINSQDQTGLIAGSYKVRITDVLGCFLETGPYIITEPSLPLKINLVDLVNVSIPGQSTGAIEVNVTGGFGNYEYEWEKTDPVTAVIAGSLARQEGLIAGVYKVTVTDDNGCIQVLENINITEPGQVLAINSNLKNVRPCYGSNNGEIQLQVVGGTPDMTSGSGTYHIVLTRGAVVVADVNDVSLAVNNLEAGFYSVVVTDANDVSESKNIEITQPPLMQFTLNVVNNVTCHGGSDAVIRVNVSGGYPATGGNYQVRLQGPGVNITRVTNGVNEEFTGLPKGDYTVLVWDDADGDGVFSSANSIEDDCFKSQNITITQPEAIATLSVVSGSEDICEGVIPQLQIIISGWSNIAANPLEATLNDGTVVIVDDSPFEFVPLTAPATGVFTYTIASLEAQGTSCSKGNGAGSAAVTVHPLPTGRIFGDTRVCEGDTAQIAVELTGSSPWSITYTDNTNVWIENNINTALHFITVYPAVTSTFKLTSVSDLYCNKVGTGMATVEVDELPEVKLSGEADPTICRGKSTNLTFTFSKGAGPWIVNWQEIIDVSGTPVVTNRSQTITISPFVLAVKPLVTTTYKLISVSDQNGGDNSCLGIVGSQDVVVTVNQYPSQPSPIIGPAEVCQGATETYSVPETNYAVGYVWDLPTGASIVNGSGTRTIEVYFDEATSTSGYLRVRGTNGCGVGLSREIYINVNRLPITIGSIKGPAELCQGTTNAAYSVDAIADATGYTWAVPAGFTIQGQGTASILVGIDPNIDSFTGKITVNPHNACGNSLDTAILNVTVYPLPVANAGLDENICADTYELKATALSSGWTGHWEVVPGLGSANIANPNSATTNVTNISRGDVTFRWTVTHTHASSACSVYDDVVIRNNNLAVNATAVESLVCDGETEINGTPVPNGYVNTSGLWEAIAPVGSAASFDSSTSPNTMVRNLEPGLNRLRWSLIQNGCVSSAEIEIMNNKPDQAIIYGLPKIDLCADVVSLTANKPIEGNGKWSIIQGFGSFSSLTNENVTVSNIAKGTNIFRWTISKGSCSSYADVVVRNNQLEVSAGDVQLICTDNTVLEGTEPPTGTTGQWTVESGGAVVFTDGTLYNTAVSNLGYGDNILRWTITKNGCESSAIVTITSDRPTTALVGSMQTICGDETILTGNDALQGNGRWSVISGSGVFDDRDDPKTSVSGIGFGDNVFRWTISKNDCSSSADLTIHNLKVYVYAGKDTVICDRVTQLHANTPTVGTTGQWNMIAGMGGATFMPGDNILPNATVGGLDYGENGFVWTITNNKCVSRDSVVIVNNGPYPVEAGPDFITNGPVATLSATTPTVGNGHWELITGGGNIVNPTSAVSQITELRRGENVFRWTVTHFNCSEYDDVTITNGETIDSNAGRDQVVCANFTTLEGNDADVAIGKWSIVQGSGIFDNVYDPNTGVTNLGFGDNIFRWTIFYSSSNSSDDVLIRNNTPDQANAGNSDVVCGFEYELRGNPVRPDMGAGLWTLFSGGGTISDSALPNSTVTELGYGENKFIYTITKGDPGEQCVSTDTVSIINGLPTDAVAGNNDTICVDYANLKPNTPIYGVGAWHVGTVGSARFDGNWARDLASGPNMLIWEISTDYCTSSDTITIVNNSPTVADAGKSRGVCDTNVTLSATPAIYGTGLWELVYGSGSIADPLSAQTDVTGLAKGENAFRWTVNNNGCTSVSTVVITNDLLDAKAGKAQAFCADNTMLEGNNPLPGVGTWGLLGGSGSANFDDLNDPYTMVRNLDQGENLLTWTIDYNGCQSVSVVSITNNNPTTADAGSKDATCQPTYLLAGNMPEIGTATWTIREGSGDFSSFTDPSARVDNLKFGANIFRWTIQHENCVSFDDVEIDFNRIDANAGKKQANCADKTILEANNSLPGIGEWSVPGGQGAATFTDINNPVTSVSELRKGDNLLRWTISYKGCVTYDDVVITNNLPSSAYAGNKQTFCGTETTLDATEVTIGTGQWTVGTGSAVFVNDLDPKTAVSGLAQGENLLIWKVSNGLCSLEDQVLITNNQPSDPYAGLDYEEICENSFQLKAATPDYGQGVWTFLEGGGNLSNTTDPKALITSLSSGTNRLKWTLSSGQCSLSDEIVIKNNTPTKANAGTDIDDCKDSQFLDGNAPVYGTGLWERVSGYGDFVEDTDPKTQVNNLRFGENIFRWKISNGNCFLSDEVVIINKTPDKANAGSDQTFCENYTVLNANDPVTGVGIWTVLKGNGKFTDDSAFDTSVKEVGFGENIYQWTIEYGDCSTSDEVTIVSKMAEAYAGEDQVVYEPAAVLNATNAGTLNARWYLTGSSTAVFEDVAFFNTRVNNLSPGVNTFKWAIDVDGCIAADYVSVDYRPVPDAGFIVDTEEGCYPLTVRFTNYSVGGTDYYWDFGDSNTSGDSNPVHTFINPGIFTVSLRSPGPDGHDGIATKNINVFDHPTASFTVNPELVYVPEDNARFYDLSNDAISWYWKFGDGNESALRNPSHKYQDAGIYDVMLTVSNQDGCMDSVTVEGAVVAELAGFIAFPSAFKPRPGVSDTETDPGMEYSVVFKPAYRDVDTYLIQVFNRWGQLIFQSTDIDAGWDGMYEGQLAPQAVYVYKASGKYLNGRGYSETGSVLLVR